MVLKFFSEGDLTITGEKIIRLALEDLNSSLDQEEMIPSEPSTPLVGPDSVVDSLALVRLLTSVERIIEEQTGKNLVLVDESKYSDHESPFSSLQTLTEHINRVISSSESA